VNRDPLTAAALASQVHAHLASISAHAHRLARVDSRDLAALAADDRSAAAAELRSVITELLAVATDLDTAGVVDVMAPAPVCRNVTGVAAPVGSAPVRYACALPKGHDGHHEAGGPLGFLRWEA
jgi:hypothetical protein